MNVMGWDHLTIHEDNNDALTFKERVVELSDDESMKYIYIYIYTGIYIF